MAARLLVVVVLVVALLAAADGRHYYAWLGPERGCVAARGSMLTVDCTLPSANLTLQVDRDGSWLRIDCQQNSTLVCEELLPEARPLVEQYVVRAAERPLEQLRVSRCALPAAPLRCLLQATGGADVRALRLQQARGPLLAEHVAGLAAVRVLRVDYDRDEGTTVDAVPWDVLRALPALRSFSLLGAALRLPALLADSQPPLPLQSLELAAGALAALPERAFHLVPNLTSLLLWANRIETIHEDAFIGLSQLVNVSLNSNRLSSLPAGLFHDATRLSRLQLYDNELAELPAGLFHGLDQLTKVELFDNRAALRLPEELFSGCSSLRVLLLQRAGLTTLPARLLHGAPLQTLQLEYNPLRRLPPELLHEQRALEQLDLTNTSLEELPEELFRHADSLRVLRLARNSLRSLGKTLFVGASSLRELYLDRNQLEDLHEDTFSGLTRLTTLSLSHNTLRLSRRRNTLRVAPTELGGAYDHDATDAADDATDAAEYVSPLSALRQLEVLDLSHNRVSLVCDDWRVVMLRLKRLDLSYNELEQLSATDMYFLSDAVVNVTHNHIARLAPATYSPLAGAPVLPTFDVGSNPYQCDCNMFELVDALRQDRPTTLLKMERARCAGPPDLEGQRLQDLSPDRLVCDLDPCPPTCSCRVVPATHKLELDCDGVPDEPLAAPESFATRLRVHRLVDLTRLPPDVELVDMSSLNLTEPPLGGANVRIDLRGNRLHEVPVELLRGNCSLLLADNPLECGCSAQAGIAELLRSRHLVEDYGALRCAAGGALPADAAAVCAERRWAALGGVLAALGLAAAVLTAAAYRYRVELRILLRKLGLWRADDASPYEYDAFVSFAHQDQQFVVEQLVPRLEAGPRPLRLCLHYRDWVVGEFIPAQIASSVERSRRTIVVLSRHFLRSLWAQLEFRAAHGRSRLVLLLLDADLAAERSLDPELRAYIAVNTYVRADDPLVWGRLRDAVLTRRRTFAERLGPPPAPVLAPLCPSLPKPGGLRVQLTPEGKLVNSALPAPP